MHVYIHRYICVHIHPLTQTHAHIYILCFMPFRLAIKSMERKHVPDTT